MKKILLALASIILAFSLITGCATTEGRKNVGMAVGGVAGGLAGNALTGGSTAGTIVGAVGGGFIGRAVTH